MKIKAIVPLIISAAIGFSAPAMAAEKPATDVLSKMFIWWNQAFKTPGAYTPANFSKFFTPDATLTLEGKTVINGVNEWAAHFQKIQAGGGDVEIVVPFKEVFEKDGMIYNYHVIRARRDGQVTCSLAAGHATVRGGKISSIVLVRAPLDAAKGPLDPQCWTK
jgi:hypothetical protein